MLLRVCSVPASSTHKQLGQVSVSVCECVCGRSSNWQHKYREHVQLSSCCNSQPKRTLLLQQHKSEKSALKGRRRKKVIILLLMLRMRSSSPLPHTQSPAMSLALRGSLSSSPGYIHKYNVLISRTTKKYITSEQHVAPHYDQLLKRKSVALFASPKLAALLSYHKKRFLK